jgi:hypothetical protein
LKLSEKKPSLTVDRALSVIELTEPTDSLRATFGEWKVSLRGSIVLVTKEELEWECESCNSRFAAEESS